MRSKTQSKRTGLKVIITLLCFIILGAFACSVTSNVLMYKKIEDRSAQPTTDEIPSDEKQSAESVIVTPVESDVAPLSLASSEAVVTADGTTSVPVRVKTEMLNIKVNWSIAFANPDATWAIDKNVTDYATVTPTADGALTATVTVLQPFGEQIVVTAMRSDTVDSATCTVDYERRLIDIGCKINIPASSNSLGLDFINSQSSDHFIADFDVLGADTSGSDFARKSLIKRIIPIYSDTPYTKNARITKYGFSITLSDAFYNNFQGLMSRYKNSTVIRNVELKVINTNIIIYEQQPTRAWVMYFFKNFFPESVIEDKTTETIDYQNVLWEAFATFYQYGSIPFANRYVFTATVYAEKENGEVISTSTKVYIKYRSKI